MEEKQDWGSTRLVDKIGGRAPSEPGSQEATRTSVLPSLGTHAYIQSEGGRDFSPGVLFASSVEEGRPNPRSGSAGPAFGAGGQVHEEGTSYEVGASSGAILGAGPASGSGVKGDQVLRGLDEVRGVEPNGGRGSDLGR